MAFDPITPPPPSPPSAAVDVRRLILLLGISCFAGAIGGRVMDPFVTTLAVEFDAPVGQAALLATAYALPFALIQPILGPIGDAIGKRRIDPGRRCAASPCSPCWRPSPPASAC